MRVSIIGAGPAGLACAYELQKNNLDVEILEASPFVGGMCRSFDLWGQRVDLGPHRFFSREVLVNNFFHDVLDGEYTTVNRLTRIYYRNRFFYYPLKPINVLCGLKPAAIATILWEYLIRERSRRKPLSLEEWIVQRFGRKLYTIFFKSYTEKLWGIPCSRIDADWAAQRIKTLSLTSSMLSVLHAGFRQKHRTMAEVFAYPKNGTGALYEKCLEKISEGGGRIYLNHKVKRINLGVNNTVTSIETDGGQLFHPDVVVSSMPLTSLIRGLDKVPDNVRQASERLTFRSTILVYLEIDSADIFRDNWIYVHSPDVKVGRITNFRNWCPSINRSARSTILCLEYWAFEGDNFWNLDDSEISLLAHDEIRKMRLFDPSVAIINSQIVRVPKCYPVYEIGYMDQLRIVQDYLRKIKNLVPIGRYGSFKYNNQDHSILMGLLAAQKICGKNDVDLWTLNTDTVYQESHHSTERK